MVYEVPKSGIIILITFYGSLSLVSTVGNLIILFVIARSKKLRGVTNMFIANLAMADILISLIVTPFSFQAALLQKWVLPTFLCNLTPFIQTLSFNVSIFTLVAISVDRFRAVIFPLETRASEYKAKYIIIPIWMASFGLSIPTYLALRVRWMYPTDPYNHDMVCDMVGVHPEYWKYYTFILVICQYVIPFIVITFCYASVAYRLHRNHNGARCVSNGVAMNVSSGQSRIIQNRGKCVKMMIIVVAIFAICWFPYQLYTTLSEVYPDINAYKFINIVFFAIHILAMSSTCYNPFIYFFFSEHYNEEIRRIFKCCIRNASPSTNNNINNNPISRQSTRTTRRSTDITMVPISTIKIGAAGNF